MKITREFIKSGYSETGGLNKYQRAILGVEMSENPMRAQDRELSDDDAKKFVELRGATKAQRKHAKKRAGRVAANHISGIPGAELYRDAPGENWHVIRFDGGCRNNGQADASGTWAYTINRADGVRADADFGPVDHSKRATNNVAEWDALAEALAHIAAYPDKFLATGLIIEGDSQIVVWGVSGKWKSTAPHLAGLRSECLDWLSKIGLPWHARWIPREKNTECDALAGAARSTH